MATLKLTSKDVTTAQNVFLVRTEYRKELLDVVRSELRSKLNYSKTSFSKNTDRSSIYDGSDQRNFDGRFKDHYGPIALKAAEVNGVWHSLIKVVRGYAVDLTDSAIVEMAKLLIEFSK